MLCGFQPINMKCIVPGVNLKVFGRAIHSLAKIGDELYFEPLEQGLSLRTVNSSRSAYACFLFFPSYFQHYDDGITHAEAGDSEEEGFRCKITMKSMMAVFRSLSTIEKTVEKCKISHNAKEARLVFELHCRHGIVKTHNLAYIECETLQAIFSKDMCPNKLTAPSKLLCEVVVNFQTTQEEITLTVRPDSLSFKNYVEDEPDPSKVVHTELNLAPEEFDQYQVGVDTDITFCLKELRAILAFGETTGLPININFESAGRPVTFCIDSDQTFEANFVLATLAEVEQSSSQLSQSQRSQKTASASQHHTKHSATGKRGNSRDISAKVSTSKNAHTKEDSLEAERNNNQEYVRSGPQSSHAAAASEENDSMADISVEELAAAMEVEQEWEKKEKDENSQSRAQSQDSCQMDENSQSAPSRGRGWKEGRMEERGRREVVGEDTCMTMGFSSPVIPVQCPSTGKAREGPCLQPLEEEEEEEDLDETVPGTPPAKKFRSLFFGSSQKGTQSTQQGQNTTVLAADTDEED